MFGKKKFQVARREARGASHSRAFRSRNSRRVTRASRRRPRRGVLLLVVLSLLVLFLMIGTAFILSAKHSELAAKGFTKKTLNDANAAARGSLLDEVLMQIVRDTDNPGSVLRSHSLLADLYGNGGFLAFPIANARWGGPVGVVGNATTTYGQIVQFDVAKPVDFYGQLFQLSTLDDAYAGQVVTFLNGVAKGVTARIIGYQPTGPNEGTFTVMAFPLANGSPIDDPNDSKVAFNVFASLNNGTRILVNGRPFSGTGAGFDPSIPAGIPSPLLSAKQGVKDPTGAVQYYETALLPNPVFFDPTMMQLLDPSVPAASRYFADQRRSVGGTDIAGRGGPNESYDAPDFQNMLLGLMPQNNGGSADPSETDRRGHVLPSLHRPDLIRYWDARLTDPSGSIPPLVANRNMLHRVMMRPNWLDHPYFTGSNATYAQALLRYNANPGDPTAQQDMLGVVVNGPWDVDNDNDGKRDSVWVDAGLPVILGPNGKLVKPLVAVLCIDLDGRINVNTAGSLDLVDFADPSVSAARPVTSTDASGHAVALAGGETFFDFSDPTKIHANTPRGSGWGVADITATAALGPKSFQSLTRGRVADPTKGIYTALPGKYGFDETGRPLGVPGRRGYDMLGQIALPGWPQSGGAQGTRFALPPDIQSRYGVGISDYGMLVLEATMSSEFANGSPGPLVADSPYEADIFSEGSDTNNGPFGGDAPFSLGELECILRSWDSDVVNLPSRMSTLASQGVSFAERNRITTESWDIPIPSVSLPPELQVVLAPLVDVDPAGRPYRRQPQTAAELFEARVRYQLKKTRTTMTLFPEPYLPAQSDLFDPTQDASVVRWVMKQLLAPELAAGLRLDVNRPIGDGRDGNSLGGGKNGVVDEPGEDLVTSRQPVWLNNGVNAEKLPNEFLDQGALFTPLDVPYNAEPVPNRNAIDDYDSAQQRQLLARHLYVLAMMTTARADFNPTPNSQDANTAKRLAQWAINAVDFRDADNIMTPFEFDLNPFDGWDVNGVIGDKDPGPDGLLNTADDGQPTATLDDDQPYRAVVWGCERPELLITETMAWHDRNTTDEADEDPNPNEEPGDSSDPLSEAGGEFDQKYRPRGAFFLELYNPWPAMPGVNADTHAVTTGPNNEGVDLGVNIAATDVKGSTPVWRVTIYGDPDVTKDPDDPVVARRPTSTRTGGQAGAAERSVYFAGFDPEHGDTTRGIQPVPNWPTTGNASDGTAFFNDYNDTNARTIHPVRPGRYLIVGSGTETTAASGVYESQLGQRLDQKPSDRPRKPLRRIELNTNVGANNKPIRLVDNDAADNATAVWRPPTAGQVAQGNPPGPKTPFAMEPPSEAAALTADRYFPQMSGTSNTNPYIADVAVINSAWLRPVRVPARGVPLAASKVFARLTVSEPAQGYVDQFNNVKWVTKAQMQAAGVTSFDPSEDGVYCAGGDPNTPKAIDTPLDDLDANSGLSNIGTNLVEPYRQVFLQRLANPLMPFDALLNPYRTVDRSIVNVTVFNGRLSNLGGEKGQSNTAARMGFSSLERGFRSPARPESANRQFDLWATQPIDRVTGANGAAALGSTRNAMNRGPANTFSLRAIPPCTLGFLNQSFMDDNAAVNADRLRIRPDDPYPMISWNNRPYVSGNELMLVPRVRSSQLLSSFLMSDDQQSKSPYDTPIVEDIVTPGGGAQARDTSQPRKIEDYPPFLHLEDFLYNKPPDPGNALNTQPSHLFRMLDLVATPSLFSGARTWLNPNMFQNPTTIQAGDPRSGRMPPFNSVSQYREPGRINLNTVFSAGVYGGLFQGANDSANDVKPDNDDAVHPGPEWTGGKSFVSSRRGYPSGGGGNNDILSFNPQIPTCFANPFRAAGESLLVPVASMVRDEVDTTLLRKASGANDEKLPLFAATTNDNRNDAERNPYFHFQPLTRLDNLVTTRSNVYAVWITIGFFEVKDLSTLPPKEQTALAQAFDPSAASIGALSGAAKAALQKTYPDNYTFDQEAGIDDGTVQRLRGFYIVDRSRPAAFQPAVDNNVEKTIRLRRRIE